MRAHSRLRNNLALWFFIETLEHKPGVVELWHRERVVLHSRQMSKWLYVAFIATVIWAHACALETRGKANWVPDAGYASAFGTDSGSDSGEYGTGGGVTYGQSLAATGQPGGAGGETAELEYY